MKSKQSQNHAYTEKQPSIDFIGIGASRSGSTYISGCLKDHPEICMSEPKEVHFFNKDYNKGMGVYAQHFTHCDNTQIRGENTPRYLPHSEAPQRIKKHYPDVKLFVCLRNPIEATYSQYFFNKARDKEGARTFEEALENSEEEKYISKRRYFTHLSRYFEYFSPDQILILIYEDIQKDPVAFMQNIYRFLGVDDTFVSPTVKEYRNTSPRSGNKARVPYLGRFIARLQRYPAPIGTLAKSQLARKIYRWNQPKEYSQKEEKPPMKQETREYLRKLYADEIAGIEKLTGRDLSFWK